MFCNVLCVVFNFELDVNNFKFNILMLPMKIECEKLKIASMLINHLC